MPPQNKALLLPSAKSLTQNIALAPYTSPGPGEIVIRTHAVALNPADYGIQRLGILISEDGYPCILGCDVAGEIVELGPNNPADAAKEWMKDLKIGDRVMSQTGPMTPKSPGDVSIDFSADPDLKIWEGKKIYASSGFQTYVVLSGPLLVKIPEHISYEEAVVLPLGMATATSCLFTEQLLNLDLPPMDKSASKNDKIVLVWGASSSVGTSGVQLATQAGYTVLGICSARNHDMVTSLGAEKCFDYNSSNFIDHIVEYITTNHSAQEVVGAFDGISTAETIKPLCEILHSLSANTTSSVKVRKFISALFPGAEQHAIHNVEVKVNLTLGMDVFYAVAAKIRAWLEKALQDRRVTCAPEKEVLGNGFEAIQNGLDRLAAKKVSGRKLVVTI